MKRYLLKGEKNLKFVTTELERTQKMLRLLNNGTNKLDHLITIGKSFSDHSGVGYKGESSCSKTIFVKYSFLDGSINVYVKKLVVKSVAIENKPAIK